MKTIKIFAFIALFIAVTSCDKNDDDSVIGKDSLAFEGSFSREFNVQGSIQRATYEVTQDKISYSLDGGLATTNYDIKKEYYSKGDNRWIGLRESNSTYYVVFFKNVTDTEITIYKKEVTSLEEGKLAAIPSSDDTENHGWNTYKKGLPISGKIENLYAPALGGRGEPISGEFTKFDFSTGEITTSETDWDIAFRTTTIIVNGGVSSGTTDEPTRTGEAAAYIANETMDGVTSVDTSLLVQDSADSFAISGWYQYTGAPDHFILPLAGKILVIKTRDGKYAKIEIASYYKDLDTSGDSRYYTFNYVYQPNSTTTF